MFVHRRHIVAGLASAALCLAMAPSLQAQTVPTLAAASDLKFAIEEVAARFEKDTGHKLRLVFGSCGNSKTQLLQGAPFHLFMSADEGFVYELADAGKTEDRGRAHSLGRIGIIVPPGSPLKPAGEPKDLAAALKDGRLQKFAIANPAHAPYGARAKEALQYAGLWEAIQSKLVLGENISQTAQFATSGSTQGGIIAVARALAREPKLLLLAERFSAVDQMNRQGLYRLLADLRRELTIPIVLVTHDPNEARMLADRLVVMDGGCVLQQATPAHIHDAPRNARVVDLVGIQNRFHGVWLGPAESPGMGLLRSAGSGTDDPSAPVLTVRDRGRLPVGQAVNWIIPSDGIILTHPQAEDSGVFGAGLVEARHLGEITLAMLSVDVVPGAHLVLTLAGAQRQTLEPGARFGVRLGPDRLHVMPLRIHPDPAPAPGGG